MNILLVHNYYQQAGGEDLSFQAGIDMLTCAGHRVIPFTAHNSILKQLSGPRMAIKAIWNTEIERQVFNLCKREKIHAAVFHNTFPLISPAPYRAVQAAGGRVLQWLHNYRLICPAATLYRHGQVCEECIRQPLPLSALVHRCYRDNLGATTVTVAALVYHRMRRTWSRDVDKFLALTNFARDMHIAGGLPAGKIKVIPNYLSVDPGSGPGDGGYALFVGRLTREKGVATLLEAWKGLRNVIPLHVYGDGPLRQRVVEATSWPGIEWFGQRSHEEVMAAMRRAALLVFPSEWYEGLPRTIIESFASGTPVVAGNIGSMVELVEDGVTGRRFRAGDYRDLQSVVKTVLSQVPKMREAARQSFEARYTAPRAIESLNSILDEVTQ